FQSSDIGAQTSAITYQGELNDSGTPAQGAHDFEFTLFDAPAGGNMIENTVAVPGHPVNDGIFTVEIDFGAVAFENGDRFLEIRVRPSGVGSYQTLTPRQPMTPTPFAITAYRVLNGAIENRSLANDSISTVKIQDGAVTTSKIGEDAVTGSKIADNVVGNRNMLDNAIDTGEIRNDAVTRVKIADGAVTGTQMADSITVGSGSDSGTIAVWNGNDMQTGVEMLGDSRRLLVYAPTGVPRASLDVPAGGRLLLNDSADMAAIAIEAEEGIESVDSISHVNAIGDLIPRVLLTSTASGGQVFTYSNGGDEQTQLGTSGDGGFLNLSQVDGDIGVLADGDAGGKGLVEVRGVDSGTRVEIDGQDAVDQPSIRFYKNGNSMTVLTAAGFNKIGGTLGIGRDAFGATFEVEGTASKTIAGDWLANSDVRIKTNISPVTGALEKIDNLRPVTFRYTPEYLEQHPVIEDVEYYNVVAQDFQAVFPEAVREGGDTLPSGDRVLQVDTHPAMITALAALKELHVMVKQQDARILELEQMLVNREGSAAP
ncbi:MAG TPA: tail fiber domain-containing protein, partial [Xanthomonadales bacterium]|nr:tail fiber domain-containing protein [Xanthomonadales bacterium]